jgi:RNA polymerase sigma-54 factor
MLSANWLVKSLDQRARTILKVATELVRQQDAFFAHGVRHLKPLILKNVAEAIQMHESTVSRVTSNKYISSPRGLFELKYFFTSAIASAGEGEAHSSESVRHRIRELIDTETPEAVLSASSMPEQRRLAVLSTDESVILSGRVSSYYMKQMAQECVRGVTAGRRVVNRVEVAVRREPDTVLPVADSGRTGVTVHIWHERKSDSI